MLNLNNPFLKLLLSLITIVTFSNFCHSQQKWFLIDSLEYQQLKTQPLYTGQKSLESLPEEIDLSKYVPRVRSQEKTNTCVAWATAYYTYGTLMGETYKSSGSKFALSPNYTWKKSKKTCLGDNCFSPCDSSLGITSAAQSLLTIGGKAITDVKNYNSFNCDISSNENSKNYFIQEVQKIFDLRDKEKGDIIIKIKQSLKNGNPIVVGMSFEPSFQKLNQIEYNLTPKYNGLYFHHAVTVVGYNKTHFTLVNSFGEKWGKKGFFKMSFDDFKKSALCAIGIITNKKRTKSIQAQPLALDRILCEVNVIQLNDNGTIGSKVNTKAESPGVYSITNLNSRYLQLHTGIMEDQAYLYLFSVNERGKVYLFWPRNSTLSAYNTNMSNDYNSDLVFGNGTDFIVPNRNSAIEVKTKGNDRLIIVASNFSILERLPTVFSSIQRTRSIKRSFSKEFGNEFIHNPSLFSSSEMNLKFTNTTRRLTYMELEVKTL